MEPSGAASEQVSRGPVRQQHARQAVGRTLPSKEPLRHCGMDIPRAPRLESSGRFGDRCPKWVGSTITHRLEETRDHLGERAGRRAQGHRQVRGPNQQPPTSRQLRMRLGVSDRQDRAGHARDPNPPGGGPRSHPAASGTADHAALQDLPALTVASPGRPVDGPGTPARWSLPCGSGGEGPHRGLMAPLRVARPRPVDALGAVDDRCGRVLGGTCGLRRPTWEPSDCHERRPAGAAINLMHHRTAMPARAPARRVGALRRSRPRRAGPPHGRRGPPAPGWSRR